MIATLTGRLAVAMTRFAYRHGRHVYLSTSCLHGNCGYCSGKEGKAGAKTPAVCKFCKAPCRCRCHRVQETP